MRAVFFLLVFCLCSFRQDKVIICKSGTAYAYHKYRCQGLKDFRHTIESLSLPEAIALKRTLCGYCYKRPKPTSEPSPGGSQCGATTKSGTKCSRTAGSNGYCWQYNKQLVRFPVPLRRRFPTVR